MTPVPTCSPERCPTCDREECPLPALNKEHSDIASSCQSDAATRVRATNRMNALWDAIVEARRECKPVDWRARCLAAERRLSVVTEAVRAVADGIEHLSRTGVVNKRFAAAIIRAALEPTP